MDRRQHFLRNIGGQLHSRKDTIAAAATGADHILAGPIPVVINRYDARSGSAQQNDSRARQRLSGGERGPSIAAHHRILRSQKPSPLANAVFSRLGKFGEEEGAPQVFVWNRLACFLQFGK